MAQFKPDTGWSLFDIYLDGYGEPAGFTVSYGSRDTLLNISVSNDGQILDMGLIYADRIWQEDTALPDLSRVRQYQFPQGPSWEDQMFRKPMWINLHPEKRELEMICLPAPYTNIRVQSCYREDRVEIYYCDYAYYDEDLDRLETGCRPVLFKVVDLTEEEYAYLKRFV